MRRISFLSPNPVEQSDELQNDTERDTTLTLLTNGSCDAAKLLPTPAIQCAGEPVGAELAHNLFTRGPALANPYISSAECSYSESMRCYIVAAQLDRCCSMSASSNRSSDAAWQ